MTPYPVRFEHVTCTFGTAEFPIHALRDANFHLNQGELIAVMGPSGSGKSTLLNIAGLLQRPTSGTVFIDGVDTSTLNDTQTAKLRRSHIGVVFQRFNLVPTLTVGENVSLPLELAGEHVQRDTIAQALAEVGLENMLDRFPDEISGGQAQRVAIARALIGPRSILLADEPTGALDTSTADEVMKVLRSRIDAGASGILVTHEPRFASWADRVLYVRDGNISE
ncbi:ABC transporter ATP-binding protein [Corynebacterium sp. HS2168-gen11]|uniref:ABC transporter ATP-binding protein n=1 Tax=Corynebacterium sp. HS2168-gen11 TaxID=2974027 RepID=UPI00216AB422|nr:ABC transporter ATP-binding protein [Corynebacterium sp. HS2168-gen11]MCS4536411.1 ABC transporter ATP-binding protein [Corynebacterium sp. HS2168-gen11]